MQRFLLSILTFLIASPASAGMPSPIRLTDLARMRVETISFFILVFLLTCGAVMGLWNHLRRDLPRLPRLTYVKSLALVGLWGFLFILVLTMISGARELMTPGAWEPTGATYKLKSAQTGGQAEIHPQRYLKLAELKAALWDYATKNDGRLPADITSSGIEIKTWELMHEGAAGPWRYIYIPGRRLNSAAEVLVQEPLEAGAPRLMLLTDGRMISGEAYSADTSDMKGKP